MTVNEIILRITPLKPVSRASVYNYFKALKIKPIGARQKPQRFPDDSADRILAHLGFREVANHLAKRRMKIENGLAGKTVVSLRTLKAERNKRGTR